MIDFASLQNRTKEYIETNYKSALETIELSDMNYIDDAFDLDKHQKNNQLFYDFSGWSFSSLSNESNKAHLTLKLYLTFKNGKSSVLSDVMYKYAAAFYEMFHKSNDNLGGIFDYGIISECNFYQAAEANINVKVCSITMELDVED